MKRQWLAVAGGGVIAVAIVVGLSVLFRGPQRRVVVVPQNSSLPQPRPVPVAGRTPTTQELIGRVRSGDLNQRQTAINELMAMGEAAAPALVSAVVDGKPDLGGYVFEATSALRRMGPAIRPALPHLIEVVQARPSTRSASSRTGRSPRTSALYLMHEMSWASTELIPVLQKLADDVGEEESIRTLALYDLGGMGKDAISILRRYADGAPGTLRETARGSLADVLEKQGIQTRAQYYTALVEADLFDPKVPDYVSHTKGRINLGKTDPLTEKVKAAYRARLKEKPDPRLALTLAEMIQRQLGGTALTWAAPTDEGSGRSPRENPTESYVTMAEILSSAFDSAEKGSEIRQSIGVGLAKLRLLQGDWEQMNRALEQLGWATMASEQRPMLSAPPLKWTAELSKQWLSCDEKMRNGDCGLVVHVEKDGRGLRGAHVLVRHRKAPNFNTGIRVDTLFFAPFPLPWYHDESFGYGGNDRAMTRYAVSDASGEVRFEKLPAIEIQIEVLVPTANFPEAGRAWDLWMQIPGGEMKRAAIFGGRDAVNSNKPPAIARLEAGKTVEYPRLVVLPQFELNVEDGAMVDAKTLRLEWPAVASKPGEQITYELEMILSAPEAHYFSSDTMSQIESSKETVTTNHSDAGANGVGGKKLCPGNFYGLGVVARDAGGRIVGRSGRRRVWVDWGYRTSDPPLATDDSYKQPPIGMDTWFRGSTNYGDGRSEDLEQKVARHLREYPNAFEREYVELGKAWLDWHAGQKAAAEAELKKLATDLPKGSVPCETAASLLAEMHAGKPPDKRLKLVGSAASK